MKKLLATFILALSLCGPAFAQVGLPFPGPGMPASGGASYQGPGDIVSGAITFVSCARVYTAAQASTSTNLCDLVASTGGAVVCTLRGSSTGFVDLAASYCAGTTPAAACAAASGGSCKVKKMYDQSGSTSCGGVACDLTNATLAQMPVLTFSALGGLPGLALVNANTTLLASASSATQAQPITFSAVAERTGNTGATTGQIGASTGAPNLGYPASVNTAIVNGGSGSKSATATDSAFHSLHGVLNGASSLITVDGVDSTTASTTGGLSANTIRVGRAGGGVDGAFMEGGIWPTAFSSGNRTSMNTNQHSSTSGYNF